MDELETPIVSEAPNRTDLHEEFDNLRHLVISSLLLLVIISGTLNVYFLRQYRTAAGDLKAMAGARTFIDDYQKNRAAPTDEFIRKLSQYSATHKDFDPIALKYGLKATNAIPAAAPAPGAGLPKK